MRKFSILTLLIAITAALNLTTPPPSFAGELDDETSITNAQIDLAKNLPQTFVVRINESTNEAAVLMLKGDLAADSSSESFVVGHDSSFISLKKENTLVGKPTHELDSDSSTNSWYFYFYAYNFNYPTFNYSGYSYNYYNYYWYYRGGYRYCYYRWMW